MKNQNSKMPASKGCGNMQRFLNSITPIVPSSTASRVIIETPCSILSSSSIFLAAPLSIGNKEFSDDVFLCFLFDVQQHCSFFVLSILSKLSLLVSPVSNLSWRNPS